MARKKEQTKIVSMDAETITVRHPVLGTRVFPRSKWEKMLTMQGLRKFGPVAVSSAAKRFQHYSRVHGLSRAAMKGAIRHMPKMGNILGDMSYAETVAEIQRSRNRVFNPGQYAMITLQKLVAGKDPRKLKPNETGGQMGGSVGVGKFGSETEPTLRLFGGFIKRAQLIKEKEGETAALKTAAAAIKPIRQKKLFRGVGMAILQGDSPEEVDKTMAAILKELQLTQKGAKK